MLSKRSNLFKLFMNDVGLLAAVYMEDIQLRILNGETDINFGSIYENVVAQELVAHGLTPSYYASSKHGEIDFMIERDGRVVPIEVKSGKHYKRHRALKHVLDDPEYSIDRAIVFNGDAVCQDGKVFYAPVYMAMFLSRKDLPEQLIYEVGSPLKFLKSRPYGCPAG